MTIDSDKPSSNLFHLILANRFARIGLIAYLLVAVGLFLLKWLALPLMVELTPRVEQSLTAAFGREVVVGEFTVSMPGFVPHIEVRDLRFKEEMNLQRPSLKVDEIRATLSLGSFLRFHPALSNLEVVGPVVTVKKVSDKQWEVAGIPIDLFETEGEPLDWQGLIGEVLNQDRVLLEGGKLHLIDASVEQPEFRRFDVNGLLESGIGGFRLGATVKGDRTGSQPIRFVSDIEFPVWLIEKGQTQFWTGTGYSEVELPNQPNLEFFAGLVGLDIQLDSASAKTWFTLSEGLVFDAQASVELADLSIKAKAEASAKPFKLRGASGQFELKDFSPDLSLLSVGISQLLLDSETMGRLGPFSGGYERTQPQQSGIENRLEFANLDAGLISTVAQDLLEALGQRVLLENLAEYEIQGLFEKLNIAWGQTDNAQALAEGALPFLAEIQFNDLTVQRLDITRTEGNQITGFTGLDGEFVGNNLEGRWSLESQASTFNLPELYPAKVIQLDKISGKGGWKNLFSANAPLDILIEQLSVTNADVSASLSGSYQFSPSAPDQINIVGQIGRAAVEKVPYYLPAQLAPRASQWLNQNLKAGNVTSGELALQGSLYDFPFDEEGVNGRFYIDLAVEGGSVTPMPDWPAIESINGRVTFQNGGLAIRANSAQTLGLPLQGVEVDITGLYRPGAKLTAVGQTSADASALVNYSQNSPVDYFTGGLLSQSVASGPADVALQLGIPFTKGERISSNVDVTLKNVSIQLNKQMPKISGVSGEIGIADGLVRLKKLKGTALGGDVLVSGGSSKKGGVKIKALGVANASGLASYLSPKLQPYLTGASPYEVQILTGADGADMTIQTDLKGLALELPVPFGKTLLESTPLSIRKSVQGLEGKTIWAANIAATNKPNGQLSLELSENGEVNWLSATVGDTLPLANSGLAASIKLDSLDLEAWQTVLDQLELGATDNENNENSSANSGLIEQFFAQTKPGGKQLNVSLVTNTLSFGGRAYADVKVQGIKGPDTWRLNVEAQGTQGYLSWVVDDARPDGALFGRFSSLTLPEVIEDKVAQAIEEPAKSIPALDIQVDNFQVGSMTLGKLVLLADNQGVSGRASQGLRQWNLSNLTIESPEATTQLTGQWSYHPDFQLQSTELVVNQVVRDGGVFLSRLGKGEIVKGGNGSLTGALNWKGSPLSIHYPSLNGKLAFKSQKGRFLKADPGAAKLLGVLSLQSLTRRLQFDFSDLFDRGFEYDEMSGDFLLNEGVANTTNFTMSGPSATVLMEGDLDLAKETQLLQVVVLPDLSATGGSLIYSILAANPAVGVVSLFADLVLKDQLAKVFALRYQVTGPWIEPTVTQIKQEPAAQTE